MASERARSKKQMAVKTPARKRRVAQRTAAVTRTRTASATAEIPGWDTLTKAAPRRTKKAILSSQPTITTAQFALWLTGLALAVTLYVGHVHATQQLFETLHALKKENLQLHLSLDQTRGELDRAAGPAVLYPKARRLGLVEGLNYGPTIHVQR